MRDSIFDYIKKEYPEFTLEDYVSLMEYDKVRKNYLLDILTDDNENEELTDVQKEVVNAITDEHIVSENIEPILDNNLTLGQKAADKIAAFGGSWFFIFIFFSIPFGWIILNIVLLEKKAFDPYPFILLNLILSCLAAIQAPIIMMSQNRVEQKDRLRSENDYKINLKAELEIKLLHERIDHLRSHQNKALLEIQQLQMEYFSKIQEKQNYMSRER